MTLILKIERALAFAKELGLNDNQTKELMAMILELPYFKLLESAPITQPMPWVSPQWDPNQPFRTSDGTGPGIIITSCACSPVGQPHSDSCKSADSISEIHKHFDH